MNLNQLTIIGFIGHNADTKQLASGTTVTKFSVATTRSWKDDKGQWKQRTQWHNALAFGDGFQQMAARLVKGTHVFVQGGTHYSRVRPHRLGSKRQEVHRACHSATRGRVESRYKPHPRSQRPLRVERRNSRARRTRCPPLGGLSP